MRSPVVLGGAAACVIIALIVVAVAILSATMPPDRSSPQATINGYFSALQQQNYSHAWQYVAQSRDGSASESDFIANLRNDDARNGHVLSAQIANLTTQGDTVTAQVDVKRAGAPNNTMSYSLVLAQVDGNTWLISSIASL